jgi:hypothetical protein
VLVPHAARTVIATPQTASASTTSEKIKTRPAILCGFMRSSFISTTAKFSSSFSRSLMRPPPLLPSGLRSFHCGHDALVLLQPIKSALQNLSMIGCYASGHDERIGDRRPVGDRRTAAAPGAAQAEGRQAPRARPGGPHRHRLRAQDGHTLGDAPQGDGLRLRFDVLAEAARLAGGGRVGAVAPGLAGQAWPGGRDRLVEGVFGLGERARQKGGRKVGKNPTDLKANRARSATLFRTEGASRSP